MFGKSFIMGKIYEVGWGLSGLNVVVCRVGLVFGGNMKVVFGVFFFEKRVFLKEIKCNFVIEIECI